VLWSALTQTDDQLNIAGRKVGLRYFQALNEHWTVALSGKYTSAIKTEYNTANFAIDTLRLSPFTTADINVVYRLNEKLLENFKVTNLSNEQYFYPNVRRFDPKQFKSAGHGLHIGLKYQF